MLDIADIMTRLATHRPIFHSEADFQHALAWEIHESQPAAMIRLEYRPLRDRNLYTDIWVAQQGQTLAIELKYLTAACRIDSGGESFDLRAAAGDIERYDCIKDISRLETVAAETGAAGLAITLSNGKSFWNQPTREDTSDRQFRVHEGRVLTGTVAWAPGTAPTTTDGREAPLTVRGQYPITWRDYSSLAGGAVRFRYMYVEIGRRP